MVSSRQRLVRASLRREWREIGGLGRLAVVGIVAAGVLAVALGFSITSAARGHLLDARAEIFGGIVDDMARSIGDPGEVGTAQYDRFESAASERLLGGETVLLKLWRPDGTIAYSDNPSLVGRVFDVSDAAAAAFRGSVETQVSDLADPAHAQHRHLESLIEFYFPYATADGVVTAVFEIEQRTDRLEAALWRIERNVWASIGVGLLVLGVFLGALALARARDLNRRRREAEELLGSLLRAQDEERRRVIGALHDDIGQPLYRLLYGIEGSKARLPESDPVRAELEHLAGVVREVDATLRAELRILHQGVLADLGLEAAITELVATVATESGLVINAEVDLPVEPDEVPRTALFRAAGELLTNVRKHAEAESVVLAISEERGFAVLSVRDDGVGTDTTPGLGLTTTRERLEAIGGSLEVTSEEGVGTEVRVRAPITTGAAT